MAKAMPSNGLFGIHVDDIMACGEGVYGPEDAKEPQGDRPSCFAERLHVLLHRSSLALWGTTINRLSVEPTWNKA